MYVYPMYIWCLWKDIKSPGTGAGGFELPGGCLELNLGLLQDWHGLLTATAQTLHTGVGEQVCTIKTGAAEPMPTGSTFSVSFL